MRLESLATVMSQEADASSAVVVEGDSTLGSADLFGQARAMATGLIELGITSGDRVAIWLPNRSAWLVAFFACAQLGAIAVSINTRFRSAEVGDLLHRSGARVLVYWPGYKDIAFEEILASCAPESLSGLETIVLYTEEKTPLPASIVGKQVRSYHALLTRPQWTIPRGTLEHPCIIFTTSGTTKAPKLVLHSQRNVLSHAVNVARQYGLTAADRFLLLPPFCGVYGFCSAMAAITAGSRLILDPSWNPTRFADLIDTHSVSHFTASNEAVAQLLDARPGDGAAFPSIRFIGSANLNPTHADIALRGASQGVEIVGLYGSSEVQALFSLRDRRASTESRGWAGGLPASGLARVRTRDPETGQLCEVGQAGELEIFAPHSRFVAYFNDDEATRNALTDDGYFKTGDLGVMEADGSFIYLARMGDTLRLGGFLVSPAEIEELMQQHPAVEACQIVGVQVRDAIRPVAFIIARDQAHIDEDEVIQYAADRLAKYKVPVKIYVVAEFPITASANGTKIQKGKLREMAQRNLASSS